MKTSIMRILFSVVLLTFLFSSSKAQMPAAIKISPENATGSQELKLTFFPGYACSFQGNTELFGLDSIAMHSSAVLSNEDPWSWNHTVPFDGQSFDGNYPYLYPDSDTSYSILLNPSSFYGTGDNVTVGINAVFNDALGWTRDGRDYGDGICKDFFIPLNFEKTSVTFNVDMSYQIFLGNFDPVFDFLDLAGNFNFWGNPGATMTDAADGKIDSIYSVTVTDLVVGQNIEYKFRINKDWSTSELAGLNLNRKYTIISGENELDHMYNNAYALLKTLSLYVNMNYLYEQGLFDPLINKVDVAGTFNNWGSDSTFWMSDPDADGIYSIVIDSLYLGEYHEYKFRLDATWGKNEFPGYTPNRSYTIVADTNVLEHWWNNDDPALVPGAFFSEYLDGTGNNNALVISNKTEKPLDLSEYALMYCTNGSDWSAPVSLTDTLFPNDCYLITHADFDFAQLESPDAVDMVSSVLTSFNGNDALALIKKYASGTRYRILDKIGYPSVNPGIGWDVAGFADATAGNRLSRKDAVIHGQIDWNLSAGNNLNDSEWSVMSADIPSKLGRFTAIYNLNNQWQIQDSGLNIYYKSIDFNNDGFGIVVGQNGIAAQTVDKGLTWYPLDLATGNTLNDIQIVSGKHTWIVGVNGTILYSGDGANWENQFFDAANELSSVFFLDSLTGYAAGIHALIRTHDGGKNWEWLYNEYMDWFTKIYFTDYQQGWLVGHDKVLRTFDGGESWEWVPFEPFVNFSTVFFYNRDIGWLGGANGLIVHTIDGGVNWTRQILQTEGMIKEIYFYNANLGWAVGDNGKVFMTEDGGANWIIQYSGTQENLNDISFISRNKGWVVGDNKTILSTLDGWMPQRSEISSRLNSIFFLDEGTGWIVGDNNAILKTVDAGLTWDLKPPLHWVASEPLSDIFFADEETGWIAASGGYIYKTIDGGESWDGINTGTSEWYTSVFFINKNVGWATASGSVIAKTSDGGNTWNIVKVGSGKYFNDVFFINSTTGWVSGQEGIILKTTNGGSNWTSQYTPTGSFMESVYFLDEQTGIAIGSDGTIIRTINGGELWTPVESGAPLQLSDIFFIDTSTGWIAGQDGVILHTSDGGISWNRLPQASENWLQSLYFVDPYNGWAVGDNGTIVKTSSSGCRDPFIDLPRARRICDGEQIEFDAGSSTSYYWNTGSEERVIFASEPGYYTAYVKNICNHTAIDSVFLTVTPLPEFILRPNDTPIICKGESLILSTDLLEVFNTADYFYFWDRSLSESSSISVDTTGYYAVTVTDGYGCEKKDSIEVIVQYPWDEKIGIVTYDATDRRNLVVWKASTGKGTEFYKVYKVLSTEKKFLGRVNYGDLTVFVDNTSMPWQQSDRYVITTVDTCGNESFYSASHKTMHLTANIGTVGEVNLIWEHYEGIPVDYYYIFRGSDSLSLTLIDSVSYDLTKTQYTDNNPQEFNTYYQIGVKLPQAIILDIDGKKAGSGPFIHSLSNLEENRIKTSVLNISLKNNIKIFPNPTTGILNFLLEECPIRSAEVIVYNSYGKMVMRNNIVTGSSEFSIDLSSFPSGLYLIAIEMNGEKLLERVILE
ncbi:MAG: T9SS type A sorting domain-containing protein [Bacteroidales bacterium]|nr:T9SS type A sorting domain-containing protein [Bacteroidales bacterium]MCF8390050.1 T9SS type A sorting domain-containing protein [Bacteroidales bacterium]